MLHYVTSLQIILPTAIFIYLTTHIVVFSNLFERKLGKPPLNTVLFVWSNYYGYRDLDMYRRHLIAIMIHTLEKKHWAGLMLNVLYSVVKLAFKRSSRMIVSREFCTSKPKVAQDFKIHQPSFAFMF